MRRLGIRVAEPRSAKFVRRVPKSGAKPYGRHKSGSDEPDSAGPDRPPSPAPATPPTRSSPSAARRSSVSFSASCSAPFCCDGTAPNPILQPVSNSGSTSAGRRQNILLRIRRIKNWMRCERKSCVRIVESNSREEGSFLVFARKPSIRAMYECQCARDRLGFRKKSGGWKKPLEAKQMA
jgi:hypothetical protein